MNSYIARQKPSTQTRRFLTLSTQAGFVLLLALGTMVSAVPAAAIPLSNTNPTALNLPNCGAGFCGVDAPAVVPTVVNNAGSFTGTWPLTVDPAYWGSFSGTGPFPAKNGNNDFYFNNLGSPVTGVFPKGGVIYFGDLDDGSGPENFTLQAYDKIGNPITGSTGWLEDAFYVSGADSTQYVQSNMPEYTYDPNTGQYLFDGDNLLTNPNIAVWLTTNTDIGHLFVTSNTDFASFGIAAPAPEPGSLLLMGSGIVGLGGLVRRRLIG